MPSEESTTSKGSGASPCSAELWVLLEPGQDDNSHAIAASSNVVSLKQYALKHRGMPIEEWYEDGLGGHDAIDESRTDLTIERVPLVP